MFAHPRRIVLDVTSLITRGSGQGWTPSSWHAHMEAILGLIGEIGDPVS